MLSLSKFNIMLWFILQGFLWAHAMYSLWMKLAWKKSRSISNVCQLQMGPGLSTLKQSHPETHIRWALGPVSGRVSVPGGYRAALCKRRPWTTPCLRIAREDTQALCPVCPLSIPNPGTVTIPVHWPHREKVFCCPGEQVTSVHLSRCLQCKCKTSNDASTCPGQL